MENVNGTAKKADSKIDEDAVYANFPLTEDTTCGFGPFRSKTLQKLANKKVFVALYGFLGCTLGATYAYFNGTITTIEKRFKIPSKTTGIISVGGDISQLMVSMVLSYYAGRGHRPRWIAVSLFTVVLACLINAAPHFLYGPGNDALALTLEHGDRDGIGVNQTQDNNKDEDKLCKLNGGVGCESMEGSFAPQVILFLGSFVGGIGGPLYYTVGTTYMDDNIKKSKTPVLISFSYFFRMLGPSAGYALASVCLKYYISPTLTPYITPKDPRWLGAWWIGWLVFAVVMACFSFLIGLFPKQLPRAAVRKMLEKERLKESGGGENGVKGGVEETERASFTDMIKSFRRLLTNPTLTCNNMAAVFYIFGYMPYWIFMPKYIETQYHQSASTSSLITGTVGLLFSAIGVLVSGFVLSRWKPSARVMAGWNVFVGLSSVAGVVSYMFLGCQASDRAIDFIVSNAESNCSANCHCDYVMYSPVCTLDESTTFISACHAGCATSQTMDNGTVVYTDCSCVPGSNYSGFGGSVRGGFCPVDCFKAFAAFLSIVCLLKFIGASGRATNFLVSVRCVDEKDKTMSMALGVTMLSIGSFIPSPIFFGYLVDKTCLVWGKTCSGTGNCWLYNGEALRFLLNITSAGFLLVGTLFDVAVWYYVKDLSIFDDEGKTVEVEATQQSMILEERRKSCIE